MEDITKYKESNLSKYKQEMRKIYTDLKTRNQWKSDVANATKEIIQQNEEEQEEEDIDDDGDDEEEEEDIAADDDNDDDLKQKEKHDHQIEDDIYIPDDVNDDEDDNEEEEEDIADDDDNEDDLKQKEKNHEDDEQKEKNHDHDEQKEKDHHHRINSKQKPTKNKRKRTNKSKGQIIQRVGIDEWISSINKKEEEEEEDDDDDDWDSSNPTKRQKIHEDGMNGSDFESQQMLQICRDTFWNIFSDTNAPIFELFIYSAIMTLKDEDKDNNNNNNNEDIKATKDYLIESLLKNKLSCNYESNQNDSDLDIEEFKTQMMMNYQTNPNYKQYRKRTK